MDGFGKSCNPEEIKDRKGTICHFLYPPGFPQCFETFFFLFLAPIEYAIDIFTPSMHLKFTKMSIKP